MQGRGAAAIVALLLMSGCGDGSPTSPSVERVSGVWMGHATLTAVSGGACVGARLQSSVGSRDIFAALVQQSGTSLTATINSQGNQTSCSYSGSSSGSSVSLSLTSCDAGRVANVRCADGSVYDVQLVAERIAAQAASAGPGTSTTTWNVLPPGGTVPIASMTLSAEFRWNSLGIPHNDFHVFDGSVLPGYVDGNIVIPEEVNPFCQKCGWF